MRTFLSAIGVGLVTFCIANAQLPEPKPLTPQKAKGVLIPEATTTSSGVEEVWEAAFVKSKSGQEIKIGHTYLLSKPPQKGAEGTDAYWTSTKQLRLEVKRDQSVAEIKADATTVEEESKLVASQVKLWLGKDRIQVINAKAIEGPLWEIEAAGAKPRTIRFDPNAVGLRGERLFLKDSKAKPGDALTYRYFEGQIGMYVTVRVAVKELVKYKLPGGNPQEYLKIIAKPDLIDDGRNKIQMPASTIYADPKTLEVAGNVMEIPGLGDVTMVRTTRAGALAPNGQLPDLMRNQSIFLPKAVPDLHGRSAAVYRVTFEGEAEAKDLVIGDARQVLKNIDGPAKAFDLHITARREVVAGEKTPPVGEEFLRSNVFVNSADANVARLARQAVGAKTDPIEMARAIEKFVHGYMRPVNFSEAMAPADHVAKTREGDCSEYAMLTAAMCRAVKVPSRTAIGLVYVNNLGGRPAFGFHMWTEVNVAGQWLGIDATLAQGSIGPGHIKICDESWDNVVAFNPLLPVQAFLMAKPKIELIEK
jgi:Transglutaminase-like superfamily